MLLSYYHTIIIRFGNFIFLDSVCSSLWSDIFLKQVLNYTQILVGKRHSMI